MSEKNLIDVVCRIRSPSTSAPSSSCTRSGSDVEVITWIPILRNASSVSSCSSASGFCRTSLAMVSNVSMVPFMSGGWPGNMTSLTAFGTARSRRLSKPATVAPRLPPSTRRMAGILTRSVTLP